MTHEKINEISFETRSTDINIYDIIFLATQKGP